MVSLSEKNPTSTFKIGGFSEKKMLFKFAETSLIIRLKKVNLPYLAVLRKSFPIGKKSNFQLAKQKKVSKAKQSKVIKASKQSKLKQKKQPNQASQASKAK